MPLALGILLILIITTHSDSFVKLDCKPCGSQICLTLSGGGLQTESIATNRIASCGQDNFPVIYGFSCGKTCSSGCQIIESQYGQLSSSFCVDSTTGKDVLKRLNLVRSLSLEEDEESSYDWCGC